MNKNDIRVNILACLKSLKINLNYIDAHYYDGDILFWRADDDGAELVLHDSRGDIVLYEVQGKTTDELKYLVFEVLEDILMNELRIYKLVKRVREVDEIIMDLEGDFTEQGFGFFWQPSEDGKQQYWCQYVAYHEEEEKMLEEIDPDDYEDMVQARQAVEAKYYLYSRLE